MPTSIAGTHVGLVCSSLTGGGAERVMLTIARGLLDRGATVDVVVANAEEKEEEEDADDVVPAGARVIDLDARRELFALPGLVRYLRAERPDSVLSTGTGVNLIAVWAKHLARVDTEVFVRGQVTLTADFGDPRRLEHRLLPFLVKHTYPAADVVIGNSEGVAADLASLTGLSVEDVRVVHNPTVTDEVFELAEEPVDLPWDVSEDVPVLVAAGRFVPQKDFATLLRAFARVADDRDVRLVLLGEGELREELLALARQLDVEDDVCLPGFVENPYAYMRRGDLFVLSSRWEGLPNVVIEALACGTQVVSTDCPSGPAEILRDGALGTLVPVEDATALAGGIRTELATDRDPDALVDRAMDFSLPAVIDDYVSLLR